MALVHDQRIALGALESHAHQRGRLDRRVGGHEESAARGVEDRGGMRTRADEELALGARSMSHGLSAFEFRSEVAHLRSACGSIRESQRAREGDGLHTIEGRQAQCRSTPLLRELPARLKLRLSKWGMRAACNWERTPS
jgi:hypothetical protein